jgi:hypothetical protein
MTGADIAQIASIQNYCIKTICKIQLFVPNDDFHRKTRFAILTCQFHTGNDAVLYEGISRKVDT